jgi:hypothetical protein
VDCITDIEQRRRNEVFGRDRSPEKPGVGLDEARFIGARVSFIVEVLPNLGSVRVTTFASRSICATLRSSLSYQFQEALPLPHHRYGRKPLI